jgi:hypothetical protein
MNKLFLTFKVLLVVCFSLAFVSIAQAQASRTWVSGVGDDANPCSRTAPCKTFAGAISKTAINGEINCLDPGSFGAVTITKSLTIDCEDTQGAMLASSVTGVTVNITTAAANDPLATVRLRGFSINGTGPCAPAPCGTRTGIRGINVSSANTRQVKLFVDELFIHGFVNEGILFNGPGGDLVVRDSLIIDNGASGIRTLSTLAGTTGRIHVSVTRTTTHLNQQGIRFEGNSFGVVSNSSASNNTQNGFVVFPVSIGAAEMNIMDSTANNNRQFGVFSGGTGQTGIVRIFNLTAFHNTTLQLEVFAGGQILSNARNHIGTPTDPPGVFTDQ